LTIKMKGDTIDKAHQSNRVGRGKGREVSKFPERQTKEEQKCSDFLTVHQGRETKPELDDAKKIVSK